jgi:GNAT superfamily N-acetyltransferase
MTVTSKVSIRPAAPSERVALEELQLRASIHSTRYAEQLRDNPDAVAIPAEQIEAGLVRVAERAGTIAGFATLLPPADDVCELDAIFVEPDHMGVGIGRLLIEDVLAIARRWGAKRIDVVANPDAWGFYEALGFTGNKEVPTRFGPGRRMHLVVGANASAPR